MFIINGVKPNLILHQKILNIDFRKFLLCTLNKNITQITLIALKLERNHRFAAKDDIRLT